ncbi:MAG: HAMP domain-containing histidine kinase [Oscillospiraceae bacterium]|nr:HAMP domain-containing histidine kinase [Oscillospiraceae bacterium]
MKLLKNFKLPKLSKFKDWSLFKPGLRRRWLINSLGISIVVVLIALSAFSVLVSNYYYSSVLTFLQERANTYANFISNHYMTDYDSYQNSAARLTSEFRDRKIMELQFISSSGHLESTTGTVQMAGQIIYTSDVKAALETGDTAHWSGNDPVTKEHIMSVSSPLTYAGDTVGVLRYVSSLERLDTRILYILGIGTLVCILFIAVMVVTNTIFVRGILLPLQDVNNVTKRIADGKYGTRIDSVYNDEIGELAAGINNMSNELQVAERMKNDFISSVSHELRTPLTAISGWGETLLQAGMDHPDDMRKGIRIMLKETRRLSKMVEDLLNFTNIESSRMTLNIEPIQASAELDEIVFLHIDSLKREGILLNYTQIGEIPEIRGDKSRLKQVFVNILDNASKHGKSGEKIDVKISYEKPFVLITVRDYGQGISPEELPYVKSKFYKGANISRGSGIGLAISEEIILLHDGELIIESTLHEGTTVTIKLPAREDAKII